MRDGFALGGGPYHFFLTEARAMPRLLASGSASASFSFVFSSSRAFRRLGVGHVLSPPYFAFQLYRVALADPVLLRARTRPAFAPASCSRKTAMICSSRNRFRFHLSVLRSRAGSLTPGGGKNSVAGQHPLTADLDIGLVQVPLACDGTLAPVEALQQLRREADDPSDALWSDRRSSRVQPSISSRSRRLRL